MILTPDDEFKVHVYLKPNHKCKDSGISERLDTVSLQRFQQYKPPVGYDVIKFSIGASI